MRLPTTKHSHLLVAGHPELAPALDGGLEHAQRGAGLWGRHVVPRAAAHGRSLHPGLDRSHRCAWLAAAGWLLHLQAGQRALQSGGLPRVCKPGVLARTVAQPCSLAACRCTGAAAAVGSAAGHPGCRSEQHRLFFHCAGNPVKFALGFASIFFDVIFMVQVGWFHGCSGLCLFWVIGLPPLRRHFHGAGQCVVRLSAYLRSIC